MKLAVDVFEVHSEIRFQVANTGIEISSLQLEEFLDHRHAHLF